MATALKLTALVLRTVDYGDSDRVVTLLSRERGKVSAFARGARASRRRFGGALEPFTLLRVEGKERPGGGLVSLESAHVERAFGGIRGDLARIACASYAAELSRELVREGEPHDELFALLVEYLARLDAAAAQPSALRAFELGALAAAGLMPRLDACARCGEPLATAAALPFDPGQGGVLGPSCAPWAPGAPRLGAATREALARYQEGGLAAADAAPLARQEGIEAREALSRFIEHHLGARLASRKFLDEVGPMLGE
jgi:DNA repair protein RecO (recombination protein O)